MKPSGCALLAAASLLVLAACTNTTQSTSNNAAAAPVPSADRGSGDMHSVSAVSDAVGRRLDDMLSTRQASR